MRRRAWGWLLAVPVALYVAILVTEPFTGFHAHLGLAGTPGRFAGTVVHAGRSKARAALWLDNVFAVCWLLIAPRLLQAGRDRWAPERRTMFGRWVLMPGVAVAAGVFDLAENLLALALVGRQQPPVVLTLLLVVFAWARLLLYALATAGLLALVVGPLAAPWLRPALRRLFGRLDRLAGSHPPAPAEAELSATDGAPTSGIALCLSGGGIRAASVGLGALRRFDVPSGDSPSLFRRARWLVAVSGGSYTAGGWRISRARKAEVPPPEQADRDGLFAGEGAWSATIRRRCRFLAPGGVVGAATGAANVAARTIVVFGAVVSAVHLVAAALGRLVHSRIIHPTFPFGPGTGQQLALRDFVALRFVVPVLALVAAAGVVARTGTSAARVVARGCLVVAAGLAALLIGVPLGVRYGNALLRTVSTVGDPDRAAAVLGLVALAGVVVATVLMVVGPGKVRVMRLGGVLLAVVLFLYAGKVADSLAFADRSGWTRWRVPGTQVTLPWSLFAGVWILLSGAIASHRLTLGGVYRKRLVATFAGRGPVDDRGLLRPTPYSSEPLWAAFIGAPGPELIVAATAHTSTPAFDGVKAYGFTFRPDRVSLHDRPDGESAVVPTNEYPVGSWWDGFPRGWLVSRSMALSGAAFASAMGREALGSTNQLLVALNLRLGAWVPNPRYLRWFADPATAPRVHLGYLVKELLGRYRPERDAFVYVADGGHRDNLGLVEALRERPDVVCCIDASADPPGTFQALRNAIALAEAELGVVIDIERALADLRPSVPGQLPAECVAEGSIAYPPAMGGRTARLLYGGAVVSAGAPQGLRDYADLHPPFPRYSTFDQFLDDDEHLQLVALGEHVADRLVERFEGVTA